jgi:hypothetical protein
MIETKKQAITDLLKDSMRKVTSLNALIEKDKQGYAKSGLRKNHILLMQISNNMHALADHVESISPLLREVVKPEPVKQAALTVKPKADSNGSQKDSTFKKSKRELSPRTKNVLKNVAGLFGTLIAGSILKKTSDANQKVYEATQKIENIEEPLLKDISEDFDIPEEETKPKPENLELETPSEIVKGMKEMVARDKQPVTTAEGAVLQTETGGPVVTEAVPAPAPVPAPVPAPAPVQKPIPVEKPIITKPAAIKVPEQTVGDAIKEASNKVGVDESIMLAMAKQESGFNPSAKAGTSSAKGLFQFIDSTWNSMVSRFGKSFPELLRGPYDALASSVAGALYIKENATFLKKNNIPVTGTNIYASHFLGAGGARTLLTAPPNQIAAEVPGLQAPAAANKNIFYVKGKTENPRTVEQVIEVLYNKVGKTAEQYKLSLSQPTTGVQVATASADVNASKRTQQTSPSTTIVNNNNMTVLAGNAPRGGVTVIARPAGAA